METSVWYCDVCGQEITDPQRALLTWRDVGRRFAEDFAIVHKGNCDLDRSTFSMELDQMLGTDGMQHMLSFLSDGFFHDRVPRPKIRDFDQFVDYFRRLYTPGYEEARRHFWNRGVREELGDLNEVAPYTEHYLKAIIKISEDDHE